MSGSRRRVGAIARKEFLHIIYDYRTLFILFLMPMVQLVMFGYALNMEIPRVDLAVADQSGSPASQKLVAQFRGSTFFRLLPCAGGVAEVEALFATRQARAALIIPASDTGGICDFSLKLAISDSVSSITRTSFGAQTATCEYRPA